MPPRAAQGASAPPLPCPQGVPLRQPIHPGRFLERHFLQPLGLSQTQAAAMLGISRRRVNEIVMGHRGLSADTAIRLALAFGWPASEWLALQSGWDSHHTWRQWQAARRSREAGIDPGAPLQPSARSDAPVAADLDEPLA